MIFETQRLIVRQLVEDDLSPFYEMESNPNVMRYTGSLPKNQIEAEKDLGYVMNCYQQPQNNFWVWAIERKSDQKFVGTCAIVKSDPRQNHPEKHEIGFRFLEKYWGKGYGKEIVSDLIRYAFENMNITELIAEVDEKNTASVRILDHFLEHVDTYFNERDQSMDRLYRVVKRIEFSE